MNGNGEALDGELNPDHPVTKGLRDQWYKMLAIILWKHRHDLGDEVVISLEDLREFAESGHTTIVADDKRDGVHVFLVNDEEAIKLARRNRQ